MSEEPTPAPEGAPEPMPDVAPAPTPESWHGRRPKPPRNDVSWAALILGVVAFVLSVVTDLHHAVGYAPGLTALVVSAFGVGVASRTDVGMARSLFSGLLSLFALLMTVYSLGGGTAI